MFDIYLSGRDLLVLPRGRSIPSEASGNWRKKRRIARAVSADIRGDIHLRGYHRRTLVKRPVTTEAQPR